MQSAAMGRSGSHDARRRRCRAQRWGGGTSRLRGRAAPMTQEIGRIPAGGFRELGPINWVLAKSAARTVRAPKMHLFATLGQHKRLFLSMMPYSAVLLRGRLPLVDTELVILRVAHLRDSEY